MKNPNNEPEVKKGGRRLDPKDLNVTICFKFIEPLANSQSYQGNGDIGKKSPCWGIVYMEILNPVDFIS